MNTRSDSWIRQDDRDLQSRAEEEDQVAHTKPVDDDEEGDLYDAVIEYRKNHPEVPPIDRSALDGIKVSAAPDVPDVPVYDSLEQILADVKSYKTDETMWLSTIEKRLEKTIRAGKWIIDGASE